MKFRLNNDKEHMGFKILKPEVMDLEYQVCIEDNYPTSGSAVLGKTRRFSTMQVRDIVRHFPEIHPNLFCNFSIKEFGMNLGRSTWIFKRKESL